jgi:hypothetical protein
MQELRELGQSDLIGTFVERMPNGLTLETVSGVSLRIDDYWLRSYLQYAEVGPERTQRRVRTNGGPRYPFDERPNNWRAHCKEKGWNPEAHPVAVIVIVNSLKTLKHIDVPHSIGPHPIVYEERPMAIGLSVQSGAYVAAQKPGTLGGILCDPSHAIHFAATCGHVLGASSIGMRAHSPKPARHGPPVEIGTVAISIVPSSPLGIKCNNRIQPGSPSVDFGLVQLDPNVSFDATQPTFGKVTRTSAISDIGQGDIVNFHGFESQKVTAEVHECNIWKQLNVNGTLVCFGDLLVLRDVQMNNTLTPLAQQGDSGAWIISTAAGDVSWDGVLIGGDGPNVYCSYAENIMNALGSQFALPP